MTPSGFNHTSPALDELAREARSQLGHLWQRVNAEMDEGTITPLAREALQRELAELARIPWDIAESLTGEPDEVLSDAAYNARTTFIKHAGLKEPAAVTAQSPVIPVPASRA